MIVVAAIYIIAFGANICDNSKSAAFSLNFEYFHQILTNKQDSLSTILPVKWNKIASNLGQKFE